MASIFLVNDNKIVSRLLQLSSEKHGYLLEEKMEIDPSRDHYDIVLIDSDKYSPEIIDELKSKITFDKLGYIGVKKEDVPEIFDMHLDKPFLPSDFVTMIEENMQTIPAHEEKEKEEESEKILSEEIDFENETLTLDLEELDTTPETAEEQLSSTEETIDTETEKGLEALKELEDLEELEDFSLDELEETVPAEPELQEGALKDIEKTEDALKELEALDEELEDVDLSLDASAVMSTGIAEQYVEESEEEKASEPSKEPEPSDQASKTALGAAVAAAAAGAAIVGHEDQKEEENKKALHEKELSELDVLEGSEAIEQESDYIKEEFTAEELANEFDTLNEEEVLKALNTNNHNTTEQTHEETETPVENITETKPTATQQITEEILHEEIVSEGEETLVESNEVEKWIRDAVAKAITPQMIQEALDGMEINVTLNFTKEES